MPTLDWIGKDKVINHHLEVPYHVLDKQYTFGADESENMIIHGDNLIALKALLPKYEGKIDCIYIDPPYNTGNEGWIYNDNVNDPTIKKWLGEVVGKEGEDLSRHDKWLCMMYPRLKLLHKLLSDDGVILISISDIELYSLKLICDEIFGVNNFIEDFIWYIDGHTDKQEQITNVHEYIVCYAKRKSNIDINYVVAPHVSEDSKIQNSFAENSITKNGAKNPPSIIKLPIGFPCEVEHLFKEAHKRVSECILEVGKVGYITREMTKKYELSYPARIDDMVVDNWRLSAPCKVYSGWANNAKLLKFIDNNFVPIDDDGTSLRFYLSKNGVIYYRREGRKNRYVQSILEKVGTTETNKYMLESMGINFDYPKPVSMIEYLISVFAKPESIILDSFAGSGTTAHAVLNLNKKDAGNRRFILVELGDYAESLTSQRGKAVIEGFGKGTSYETTGTGGSFSFYELGAPIILDDKINSVVPIETVKEFIYYLETKQAYKKDSDEKALLGVNSGCAYYFFYTPGKTVTLNRRKLSCIKTKAESYVIYADNCTLSDEELKKYNITFKKPGDIGRF